MSTPNHCECEDCFSLRNEVQELRRVNSGLKRERDLVYKTAESWMNDYQKLKDKYEPMEIVTSGFPEGASK